jgi:hypothetical protein
MQHSRWNLMIEDSEGGSSQKDRRLTVVGWCIIVMGISLALVVELWLWIGHIGPSAESMKEYWNSSIS